MPPLRAGNYPLPALGELIINIVATTLPVDLGSVRTMDPALLLLDGYAGNTAQTMFPDGRTLATRIAAARSDLERLAAGWRPDESDLGAAVLIDDWAFNLQQGLSIVGRVRRHPTIVDGHLTATSVVVAIDVEEARWVRTLSRWYALGRPEGTVVN